MSLQSLMDQWNKDSKANVAVRGIKREILPRIPFSAPIMNYQTYGGLPRKRVIEFFGPEGSGKTTTALDIVKNAQILFHVEWEENLEQAKLELEEAIKAKKGKATITILENEIAALKSPKQVIYLDLENTLDEEWAKTLGVDLDNLWIVKPLQDSAESILEHVLDMFRSGEVGLIVLDSLPYMVSQNLFDESLEKKAYAGISAPLTEFSRKVTPLLTKHDAMFLGINQVREDMTSTYNAYTTPGGKMWKHACAVRLRFRKGAYFDASGVELKRSAENPHGNRVESFVEKTKAFRPDRKLVSYALSYHESILVEDDLIDVAVQYGVVHKGGAWFTYIDRETGEVKADPDGTEYKFQGKPKFIKALKDDDNLFNAIMEEVHEIITTE